MTKQDPAAAPSEALLAAQQRLLNLRKEHRARRVAQPTTAVPTHGRAAIQSVSSLPDHLGWESATITAVVRREHQHLPPPAPADWLNTLEPVSVDDTPTLAQPTASPTDTVLVFPDVALGMLRENRAASGRLWLLLRHLDRQGCGWLTAETIRTAVTSPTSPYRICGKRQLRNLLRDGDQLFWTQRSGRLWLRSNARVAAALGVARVTARPVALPIAALTGRIGTVRAHFYATFHSARTGAPIARETLARVTAVAERTQRQYEQRIGVERTANFAIGERATSIDPHAAAWEHGRGGFTLIDHTGQNGQPGRAYQAWQLPNSYSGPHPRLAKHARTRVNRRLVVLQQQGKAGNDQSNKDAWVRRYASHGREAAKLIQQNTGIYWPAPSAAQASTTGIWYAWRR